MSRKKLASEASTMKSSETRKPKLKIACAMKQSVKRAEDGQSNSFMDVESPAQGTAAKPLASPLNQPVASADVYRHYMVSFQAHLCPFSLVLRFLLYSHQISNI